MLYLELIKLFNNTPKQVKDKPIFKELIDDLVKDTKKKDSV